MLSNNERHWRPYNQAAKFAQSLNLTSKKAWARYVKGELTGYEPIPEDIPKTPEGVYEEFKHLAAGVTGWVLEIAEADGGLIAKQKTLCTL